MGFNQNLFFIDIFAYEDVVKNIMETIKEIISYNIAAKDSIFLKKFEIYKDSALEELDSVNHNSNTDFKMRMHFYEYLYDKEKSVPIYNYLKFPVEEYRTKEDIIGDGDLDSISSSIIHGNIFGYCNKTQAENIYNTFYVNNEDNFNNLLSKAHLNNFNLSSSNFQEWINEKYDLKEDINIDIENCSNTDVSEYFFIHWSSYNLKELIISNVLDIIINNDYNDKNNNGNSTNSILIKSKAFSQGQIYIQINSYNKSNDYTNIIRNYFFYCLHYILNHIFISKNIYKK